MEAQQPQDDHNAPDETPAPARPSLVRRLRALVFAPFRIGRSLVALVLAPVRKLTSPLVRLMAPLRRLAEVVRTQILKVLSLVAGPLQKLAAPAAKVVAPLRRLGFLVRPLAPLWNRVASRVPASQRWKIAAVAGVASVLIMAEVGVRLWLVENDAKQFPEVTAAMALDVLDQGDYREAKKLVQELTHWTLTPQQKAATEYVLGAIAAHDALEFEGRRQAGMYALAAQHLQQAREQGLPPSRIAKGAYLLGKCLHGAGQAAASRAVLEEALDTASDRATEIHWLLAENYRLCEPRKLDRALEHCDKYLTDDALVASDRQQGLLERSRILFDLGKLDECNQTLEQIPVGSRFHSYVLVMRARILMYEARGLTAAAGQVADAAPPTEARVKYQDAMDLLRQAQGRGQQEMQATRESSYLIGMCLLETHDARAARDQFSRTARMYLEFEEGTAAALREADLLREADQDDEAITAYGHAVGAAGTAASYRNAYISVEEFRDRLTTAFKVYAIGKHFERAVQIADLSEPLLTRDLRIPMAAEAHQGWAGVLMAKAEGQRLAQATTTRQMAREQLRLAGKEYLQAARLRLSTRQHPEDLWQAVQCFMDGHDYVRAILAVDEYMSAEPRQRRPLALLNLGEARLALGQFDKAWEALNECLESFATDAASYRARLLAAKTFIEREQYDKAETLLRDNLNGESLTPASAEWRASLYALGNLLHLVGRYDEAIASLDEAVARYPEAPEAVEARYLLAESYRRAAQKPKEKLQSATIESARIAHARQMQQLLASAVAHYEQVQDTLIRREEQTELTSLEQTILRNCCAGVGSPGYVVDATTFAFSSTMATVSPRAESCPW
jgi:tetratricopeptide (TPR) repeat protein